MKTPKKSPRIPVSLSPEDRKHLQVLADAQGVNLSEAVRRSVLDAYERMQEAEVRPRIEDPLRVELEQMKAKLAELDPLVVGTSLRLLALINCSKGRAEIEAELTRLVRA
jgi:hypothetical protein